MLPAGSRDGNVGRHLIAAARDDLDIQGKDGIHAGVEVEREVTPVFIEQAARKAVDRRVAVEEREQVARESRAAGLGSCIRRRHISVWVSPGGRVGAK